MGNFDTKHSPYYAISDESTTEEVTNVLRNSKDPTGTHTLWTIKRANYDGKNGTLFEFNSHKATQSNKQLGFALNQIRVISNRFYKTNTSFHLSKPHHFCFLDFKKDKAPQFSQVLLFRGAIQISSADSAITSKL